MGKSVKLSNDTFDKGSGESWRFGPEFAQITSVGPLKHEKTFAVSGHRRDELDNVWVFQPDHLHVCFDLFVPTRFKLALGVLIVAGWKVQFLDGNVGLPTIQRPCVSKC